jgi:hypothetical protein
MWPSLNVTNSDYVVDMGHAILNDIAINLMAHPRVDERVAKSIASQTVIFEEEKLPEPQYAPFAPTGDGWFEDRIGKSANEIIKDLRKARRVMKDSKDEIDNIISSVRTLKSAEVDATLAMISWGKPHYDTMRKMGLADKDLRSLRLFGKSRQSSLLRACNLWESAEDALAKLDEFEDVWGEEEKMAWVNAMETKQDARKMWKSSLHQIDNLSKEQQKWMRLAKEEVSNHGSMSARAITENLIEKGVPRLNSNRLSKLLNMYGEEINIVKAHRKGEYMCIDRDGLVIKDPWSYAAGFFDSNGYVNISDRGEPKVGLVTKGKTGRMHCEQLYKGIGFGTLQLDQKVYQDSEQSQHRVTFLKSEDVAQFLQNIYPNLRIKGDLAKAMITYVNSDNKDTKGKVKKFLQYTNAEGTAKGDKLLMKWDVDRDTVVNWLEEF